jgi:hypothetical protein
MKNKKLQGAPPVVVGALVWFITIDTHSTNNESYEEINGSLMHNLL